MGRYYSGDIEGKFWFGTQSSNAADRFGDGAYEPGYIPYCFDSENFGTEILVSLLEAVNKQYGKQFTLETDPDDLNGIAADSDIADAQLGLKIYQCIQAQGECSFDAEC